MTMTSEQRSLVQQREPLYELPCGIKVIGECHSGRYVRCYIVAHSFFPNSKINKQNRQIVQRARVVMTAAIGRPLATNEHVHHIKEHQKHNDNLDNLEILWSDEHNKHHKLGFKHSEEVKLKIGKSLKKAYDEGRHELCPIDTTGTTWITNGKENRLIRNKILPEGWRYGMTSSPKRGTSC